MDPMTTSHNQLLTHGGDRVTDRVTDRVLGYGHEPRTPAPPWRQGAAVAAAVAATLVPWTAWLSSSLPPTALAYHWSAAWTGLDAAIAGCAATSAVLLARRDRRAALSLVATATLMLTDSWFDVCTSAPGHDLALAVAEALGVELPLATAALGLARRLPNRDTAPPQRARPEHGGEPPPRRGTTPFRHERPVAPLTLQEQNKITTAA